MARGCGRWLGCWARGWLAKAGLAVCAAAVRVRAWCRRRVVVGCSRGVLGSWRRGATPWRYAPPSGRATRRVAPPLRASPSAPPPPRRRPQSRRARVARSPQRSPARRARLNPPATAPEPQQAATPASHSQPRARVKAC